MANASLARASVEEVICFGAPAKADHYASGSTLSG